MKHKVIDYSKRWVIPAEQSMSDKEYKRSIDLFKLLGFNVPFYVQDAKGMGCHTHGFWYDGKEVCRTSQYHGDCKTVSNVDQLLDYVWEDEGVAVTIDGVKGFVSAETAQEFKKRLK